MAFATHSRLERRSLLTCLLPLQTAFEATNSALTTLGYKVTVYDKKAGRVKTSPKVAMVTAVGGKSSAQVTETSIAWNISVSQGKEGALVNAQPRAFRGGQEITQASWSADYANRMYDQLFLEIKSELKNTNLTATKH